MKVAVHQTEEKYCVKCGWPQLKLSSHPYFFCKNTTCDLFRVLQVGLTLAEMELLKNGQNQPSKSV